MYESKTEAPIAHGRFIRRLLLHTLGAVAFLIGSLAIGMVGYKAFEKQMTWVDAFVNSAMLLGGMGPVGELKTNGGKIFAGIYALYAGLAFIVTAAVLLTPVLHRVLHRFHWDEKDSD